MKWLSKMLSLDDYSLAITFYKLSTVSPYSDATLRLVFSNFPTLVSITENKPGRTFFIFLGVFVLTNRCVLFSFPYLHQKEYRLMLSCTALWTFPFLKHLICLFVIFFFLNIQLCALKLFHHYMVFLRLLQCEHCNCDCLQTLLHVATSATG